MGVQEEAAAAKAATNFHAAPAPSAAAQGSAHTTKPRVQHKAPTEPLNVVLSSDLRAAERERFEAVRRKRAEVGNLASVLATSASCAIHSDYRRLRVCSLQLCAVCFILHPALYFVVY